jgi:hypothetical protein
LKVGFLVSCRSVHEPELLQTAHFGHCKVGEELTCLVAGKRLEWPVGREAILGVSAGISQYSDAPGLDGFANLFLYLLEW